MSGGKCLVARRLGVLLPDLWEQMSLWIVECLVQDGLCVCCMQSPGDVVDDLDRGRDGGMTD